LRPELERASRPFNPIAISVRQTPRSILRINGGWRRIPDPLARAHQHRLIQRRARACTSRNIIGGSGLPSKLRARPRRLAQLLLLSCNRPATSTASCSKAGPLMKVSGAFRLSARPVQDISAENRKPSDHARPYTMYSELKAPQKNKKKKKKKKSSPPPFLFTHPPPPPPPPSPLPTPPPRFSARPGRRNPPVTAIARNCIGGEAQEYIALYLSLRYLPWVGTRSAKPKARTSINVNNTGRSAVCRRKEHSFLKLTIGHNVIPEGAEIWSDGRGYARPRSPAQKPPVWRLG